MFVLRAWLAARFVALFVEALFVEALFVEAPFAAFLAPSGRLAGS